VLKQADHNIGIEFGVLLIQAVFDNLLDLNQDNVVPLKSLDKGKNNGKDIFLLDKLDKIHIKLVKNRFQ
jgi:hypothetical protein